MEARRDRSAQRRILIVEDDAALLLALSDRLTQEGYQVASATDGDQAAAMVATREHDLVILDVMLPGKSGFEIAREARNQGLDTPILMLTARGEVTDRVVGLEFGADDYLTKPFEFIELLARIQALLFRAAASYRLYMLSGETATQKLQQAQNDIREIKNLSRGFSPYIPAFSPKFLNLFRRSS